MPQDDRWLGGGIPRGTAYDRRFDELAAAGEDVHGEANFVASLSPSTVLDAGCGTGRVAIELARRGIAVVGVDADPVMLEAARRKAPDLEWVLADLATLELGRRFDVAVTAGNVMLFLAPGTEPAVVARLAAHLEPDGRLVAGFSVEPAGLHLGRYDGMARSAGLVLESRWATWSKEPFIPGGGYAVSVHRRLSSSRTPPGAPPRAPDAPWAGRPRSGRDRRRGGRTGRRG